MQILNQTQRVIPNETERRVIQLKRLAPQQFNQLLNGWKLGISMVWDATNPQEVFDGLGELAGEFVLASSATVTLLEYLKAGCTAEYLAKVKPHTVNPDGTVTID
jgi:hypothetical protein